MGRVRWPFERRVEAWVSALEHNARRAQAIAAEYERQREPLRKRAFQADSGEYRTCLSANEANYWLRTLVTGRRCEVRGHKVSWWLDSRLPFPRVPSPLEIARRVSWRNKGYSLGRNIERPGSDELLFGSIPITATRLAYPVLSAAELALWDLCSLAVV